MYKFQTLGLVSKTAAEDNPNFGQSMNGPNAEGLWDACVWEKSTLQKLCSCTQQVICEEGMNAIQSTWAYKIKRFPYGLFQKLIQKLKARFCVRGDMMQMEGVDFFNTFTEVVQYATIRLLLNLDIMIKLKSEQFVNVSAFCQAPIKEDADHDELPRGWQILNKIGIKEKFKKDCVSNRNQSLYGLRQSPRNLFLYLKGNLEKTGFHQSKMDPCLFISVHFNYYVDTDFASLWNAEDNQDPHCMKSRTRYVICVDGSPIVWSSKLQTLIASSTMESEYIAMSTVCGKDGGIMVKKIGTKDQLADIFTKGLGPILFEDLRERLCGWTSSIELKPPIAQAREGVKR